jgi:hypothetical protein
MNEIKKKCTKCSEEKNIELFYYKRAECKDCSKAKRKEAYKANPEIQKERSRKRRVEKKDEINLYLKEWRLNNKDKQYKYNKDRWNFKRDECVERNKKYWNENKERLTDRNKEYYEGNKLNIINKNVNYERKRSKEDELYRLTKIYRTRTKIAFKLKGFEKPTRTSDLIGCTPQEFKEYLESKFTEGMTWENRGLKGWHLDHIIPLCSAKNKEELEKLCHYTNIQPLWWQDNLKKGKKY